MNYRKICTFVLLCFSCITAYSENGIVLHQTNGTTVSYAFQDEPKVTYSGEMLVMTAAGVVVEYPIATLQKLTFTEAQQTSIGAPLVITPSKGTQQIFSVSGQLIRTFPEGSQITTTGLPTGTYIIRSNNITYKINISR